MILDWPVYWHDEIDSTNSEAKRLAGHGIFQPCWIAARTQTAGRGRLGRSWVSPAGNLFTTALFEEPSGIAAATRIPFAAALAVSDTIHALAPMAAPKLKWPNDVRQDGAKLSGILIEAGQAPGRTWVAAGIGINVTHAPDGAGQAASSISDIRGDKNVTAEMTLEALRTAFAKRLLQARASFQETLKDWQEQAEGLGETVRVSPGGTVIEGIFKGLAQDGGLILQLPNGEEQTIRAGDVELIKRVEG